jgi:hypothetical protein
MAQEWSHSTEAYEDAKHNTHGLPLVILQEIYAKWKTWDYVESLGDDDHLPHGWHDPTYEKAMREARSLSAEALADYVWKRAKEQRTCDNGGHLAWLCPYGCGPHCVPFDRVAKLIRAARKRGREIE